MRGLLEDAAEVVKKDLGVEVTPRWGGLHVKDLEDGLCVDVLRMIFTWRIVRSCYVEGSVDGHGGQDRAWDYAGTGLDTVRLAVRQALAWDGADKTEPEGWIKRVIDLPE